MSSSALAAGLRHLRRQLAAQQPNNGSDEQLLHAFTSRRDDGAFAVLMRRHGPMVLHVCRRVLGHEQDAEDAFQATFLVLARNAATLRQMSNVAGYLHGTAHRTAMKAKQSTARRRKYEGQTPARPPVDPADELSWREVRVLLDEEIARLPETYRSVFVLCCLEGLSQVEASRRLELKERTVSNRLTAARKWLAKRLSRRGVELTAVLAATAVVTPPVSALPAGLMATTIEAATATGDRLAGIVSASVAELVKSATTAMMMSKGKIAAVVLLIVATSGSLVGLFWRASGPLAATVEPPAAKTDAKPPVASPKHGTAKTVEISGRVLGPEGKPKAGAKLLLLGKDEKVVPLGVSAAEGRFTVAIPKTKRPSRLIAQSDGTGIDFVYLDSSKSEKQIELRLVKDNPIHGRIINTEGKPIRGVRVWVTAISTYESFDVFLDAWKKHHDGWSDPPGHLKNLFFEPAVLLSDTTNGDGRFVLHGVGVERTASLQIRGPGIADAAVDEIVNRNGFDAKPYNRAMLENTPKDRLEFDARTMLSGPDVSIVAEAEKPIRGIVKEAGTGKGRANVVVHLSRISRMKFLDIPLEAKTDANGRYEFRGARKTKSYILEVQSDPTAGYVASHVTADDTPGYQPVLADITVKKGVIITGKVIDRATGKSIPGFAQAAALRDNPFAKEYRDFNPFGFWSGSGETEANGSFRIVTIPGPVLLMGGLLRDGENFSEWIKYKPPAVDAKYPQYFFKNPEHVMYYGLGGGITPVQGHFCKVLDIKPDTAAVKQDIIVERVSALAMRIEDTEGRLLSGVWASGFTPETIFGATQIEKDSCAVYDLESRKPRLLVCYEPTRKLVAVQTLKGDEKPPIVVKLGAPGAIKGRLHDANGKPLAGVVIDMQYRNREAWEVHYVINKGKQIVTDAEGAFAFDTVIPDLKWELAFHRGKWKFERETKPSDPTIQVKSGDLRDLGTIRLKRIPEKDGE